jgi:hypothetical protein
MRYEKDEGKEKKMNPIQILILLMCVWVMVSCTGSFKIHEKDPLKDVDLEFDTTVNGEDLSKIIPK